MEHKVHKVQFFINYFRDAVCCFGGTAIFGPAGMIFGPDTTGGADIDFGAGLRDDATTDGSFADFLSADCSLSDGCLPVSV